MATATGSAARIGTPKYNRNECPEGIALEGEDRGQLLPGRLDMAGSARPSSGHLRKRSVAGHKHSSQQLHSG